MKILVTGNKGKLGSEFAKEYGKEFDIVGYDVKGGDDLFDYPRLLRKMEGCEQVVHLAAIPAPVEGKTFDDYFNTNDLATYNVIKAAVKKGLKRVIYASSTSYYGIERGIPFKTPIKEDQPVVSQYIKADQLTCRDVDLAYHVSKVIAEQMLAWFGLRKKIQTVALRFGPIDVIYYGTRVSIRNAVQAIKLALVSEKEFWYEPFSIVDEINHIDISKAKDILGYKPENSDLSKYLFVSNLDEKAV